ncbi:hypothetical protein [Herbiconiux sp. L3-i23]|uniref:hypothetical protein n=1 Tax=Herbiconiux sp. L3-i23 TaxID=2905871 RepID=UPI00205279EC|nr:hypothetical protein [Herbiconiux sp. L3-i23]BDI22467.1 hypothetical protein L3i23_12430 [Herbiconiux sp. L3-i23]
MSDPNVEPTLGDPDYSTLVPDMNGGAAAVPPAPGTENDEPLSEEGIDITEADGPDLQAGDDLDTGAATR